MKRLFTMLLAATVCFTAVPAQGVFAAEEIATDEEAVLVEDAVEVEADAETVEQDTEDETGFVNEGAYGQSADGYYEADRDEYEDDEEDTIGIDKMSLFAGDFAEAQFSPEDSDDDTDTGKTVWSIDKPSIAKIIKTDGDKCVIKALKKGKITITAKLEGYATGSKEIEVQDLPVMDIECLRTKSKNTFLVSWVDDISPALSGNAFGYSIYINSKKVAEIDSEDVETYTVEDGDIVYGPFGYYLLKAKNGSKYSIYVKEYMDVTDPTTSKKTRIYGKKSNTENIVYFSDFKVESVKNNGKKALTIKWSAKSKVSGYQIEYATNKIFDEAKTVNIKSSNIKSKKITGLKKGKTYYVRIRPYKIIGKKKYYGDWLELLTGVKIKK